MCSVVIGSVYERRVDFAITGLTCARRAAGRGRSKGVLAEEGACPTAAGICSELSSGSAGTGVRYHDRAQKDKGKRELEEGGRRRKGEHLSFVAGRTKEAAFARYLTAIEM